MPLTNGFIEWISVLELEGSILNNYDHIMLYYTVFILRLKTYRAPLVYMIVTL